MGELVDNIVAGATFIIDIVADNIAVVKQLRGVLNQLKQAAAAANLAEHVCEDIAASISCNKGIICDLLRDCKLYPKQCEQLNRDIRLTLKLAVRALDEALFAVYGHMAKGYIGRLRGAKGAVNVMKDKKLDLDARLSDISRHLQHATYKQVRQIKFQGDRDSIEEVVTQVNESVKEVNDMLKRLLFGGPKALTGGDRRWVRAVARGALKMANPSGMKIRDVSGVNGLITFSAVSADGEVVAVGGRDTPMSIWEVSTGQRMPYRVAQHFSFETERWSSAAAWRPGHQQAEVRRIAVGTSHGGVVLYDAPRTESVSKARWFSKEKRVADVDLVLVRRLQGVAGTGDIKRVSWSPDGRWLAASCDFVPEGKGDGQIEVRVWDAETGEVQCTLPMTDGYKWAHSFNWSPDGSLMAVADHHVVRVWEVATCTLKLEFEGCNCVSWSVDGTAIACCGRGDRQSEIDMYRFTRGDGRYQYIRSLSVKESSGEKDVMVGRGVSRAVRRFEWSDRGDRILVSIDVRDPAATVTESPVTVATERLEWDLMQVWEWEEEEWELTHVFKDCHSGFFCPDSDTIVALDGRRTSARVYSLRGLDVMT